MTAPRTHDRMAGAYCKPWCIYCRRAPGIDCSDFGREPRWRRRIDKENLRRYVTKEMEDEMSRKPTPGVAQARKLAEEQGYDATIRPWSGGWEILHINGPGVEDGATQACTLDEAEYMVRDYVCCTLGLDGDGDEPEEWDEGVIPVRLTLDLEARHRHGTRATASNVYDGLRGQQVTLVEEITWWVESPEAE